MSRRERLEAKLAKRQEWGAKASAASSERFESARKLADSIPFGQPILVGHHSEKHARRDQDTIHSRMRAAVDKQKLASHHAEKASGLEDQLSRSIFSDDVDAIEKLQEKLVGLQDIQARMKNANKAIRSNAARGQEAQVAALVEQGISEKSALGLLAKDFAGRIGFASYQLTNNSAEIRRTKARIDELTALAARAPAIEAARVAAEEAGGVTVTDIGSHGYCHVRFSERPDRDVLTALKAAGFRWLKGDMVWQGLRSALPDIDGVGDA